MTGKKSTDRFTPHQPVPLTACCAFTIGDLAVYPGHGVGEIISIERKMVNGEPHDFFMMKILENNLTIMIPVKKVQMVGLRALIDEADIPKIYDIFTTSRDMTADTQTWNRRYREYMDKIKTGSIYDVAIVFRDLYILRLTKDLSFGERKLYDTAQTLLVKELSTSRQTSEASILSEIETLFSQGNTCR